MIKILQITISSLLFLFLTACGSGGGDATTSPEETPDTTSVTTTGYLIDSAVGGVSYYTATRSGITAVDGSFVYDVNDSSIVFKIGGVTIHDFNLLNINPDKQVLITDLVGVERDDTTNAVVIQILQLLQSLDSDNDASNGITIDPQTALALQSVTLDFSGEPIFIEDINATLIAIGEVLVSEEEAVAHFEETLNDDFDYDVDSIAPIFISSNSVDVEEDQLFVLNIEVLDSTDVTLTLSGLDFASFNLDGTSLFFKNAPDFETQASYELSVTARDSVGNETTQNISVTILDVNYTPVITSALSVSVNENQTSAITITADDAENDALVYSLSGGDSALFTIDGVSGEVTFNSAPDYETQTSYTFTVTASDGINEDVETIIININNLNDNTPVITSALSVSVNENQTSAITITANDADNDSIAYSISGGDSTSFSVDGVSGEVTFNNAPDYETQISYTFNATASDGVYEDVESVTININNIAETVPTLTDFTAFVDENVATGTVVGNVTIADSGDTVITSFTLSDTINFLVSVSGEVTTRTELDFENTPQYSLTVYATNGAGNSTSVDVTININNIAETAPTLSDFTASIDENMPTGTVVGNVTIADSGDTAITLFTLSDDTNFLVSATGEVTTKTDLDFEDTEVYSLTVFATNEAGDSTSVAVTININNIAETVPTLTDFTASIDENVAIGTVVGSIITSAGDTATSSYTLSDPANFDISITGEVTTKTDLDFEDVEVYNLTVFATNDAGDSIEVDVTININNIAEIVPTLTDFTTSIDENLATGTVVGSVTITDAGDTIITSFTLSNSANFDISITGEVTTNTIMDYEQTQQYSLTVYATNEAGNSTSVDVTINITNLNDNTPVITSDLSVLVNENQTSAITMVASDDDNNPITYSISGGDSTSFTINGVSGEVTFNSAPDYETQTSYTFTVTASDGINEDVETIIININNLNDNTPVITSVLSISVNENQTSAITITADDADNDSITYSISGGDSASFTIDAVSGEVTFNSAPDYETQTSYTFSATASDGVYEDVESITIDIDDIIDTSPTLADFTASVNEDVSIGTVVGNITISDAGDSAITSFTLINTTNFLVSASGEVTTKTLLDFETTEVYNLTVYATNTNGDSNVVDVVININDIVDTSPTLENFTASVDENVNIGTVVGSVTVTDAGDSAITLFTLSNTNFEVDVNGEVTTNVDLDFEITPQYSLTVYATNTNGDSNVVNVTINVNDIYEPDTKTVPTLVVVMNWTDYSETDPLVWHNKIFNIAEPSVNQWFDETTGGEFQLVPVDETSETINDGIIMVDMSKNHPGDGNATSFRNTEIYNAITNLEVVDNMDFAALDTDGDGSLDRWELQIVLIVAGGETSYNDHWRRSIWAHAWSFDSLSAPVVDGVEVMKYTGIDATSGSYGRFGATHGIDDADGGHKATIGIIAHELGHSWLALGDYYDNGGGSGLGWYDIMSGGSWALQTTDAYAGETPMQYSAYNRIDADLNVSVVEVSASQDITIECSSGDLIKLVTTKANEYFLIECRDTAKMNSDIAFEYADASFGSNRLFMMTYHVDTDKANNTEDGPQTSTNHYMVALVEKDTDTLMTSTAGISADYADVYTLGDVIDSTRTKLYDGTVINYAIKVIAEDYTGRTMTIRITK